MSGGDTGPKIYFSDVFGLQPDLQPDLLEDYGAFNIALINDLPLLVDPFLLYDSQNDTYRGQDECRAPGRRPCPGSGLGSLSATCPPGRNRWLAPSASVTPDCPPSGRTTS